MCILKLLSVLFFSFIIIITHNAVLTKKILEIEISFLKPDELLKPKLDWFECDPFIHGDKSTYSKNLKELKNSKAECSYFPIPLLWTLNITESNPTYVFNFVKRFPAYSKKKKGQIIFLVNPIFQSPRFSTSLISPTYDLLALQLRDRLDGEYDLVIPHMFATCLSRPQALCPLEMKEKRRIKYPYEFDRCLNTLIHNSQYFSEATVGFSFSTLQTSLDVLNLIRLTKYEELERRRKDSSVTTDEKFKTIHFSAGFNSLIANGLMQMAKVLQMKRKEVGIDFANELGVNMNEFIDMVISETMFSPHSPSLNLFNHDFYFNDVVTEFLRECYNDNFCKQFYSENIIKEEIKDLYRYILPECYKGTNLETVHEILSEFARDSHLRKFVLPIIYRANRCLDINWKALEAFAKRPTNYEVLPQGRYITGKVTDNDICFLSYWPIERTIAGNELVNKELLDEVKLKLNSLTDYIQIPFSLGYTNYFYYSAIKRFNYESGDETNITMYNVTSKFGNWHDSYFKSELVEYPMLLMSGRLTTIPFERNPAQWLEHFIGSENERDVLLNGLVKKNRDKDRYFVEFPLVGQHSLLTAYLSKDDSFPDTSDSFPNLLKSCGAQLAISFIQSNGKNISTDCLIKMYDDYINNSDPVKFRRQLFDPSFWSNYELDLAELFFHTRTNIWDINAPLTLLVNYYWLNVGLPCAAFIVFLLTIAFSIVYVCFKYKKERLEEKSKKDNKPLVQQQQEQDTN
ncbi:hypothetical protein ABK040_014925 [Willaertia magna]